MVDTSIKNNIENESGKNPVQKRALLTDYVSENFNKIFLVDGRFGRLVGLEEKGDFFFIFKIPEKSRYNSAKYDLIQYDTELISITQMDVQIKQEIWMNMRQQDCKEEEEILFGLGNAPRSIGIHDVKAQFKHLDIAKEELEKLKYAKFYISPLLTTLFSGVVCFLLSYLFTHSVMKSILFTTLVILINIAYYAEPKNINIKKKIKEDYTIYISQDFVNIMKQATRKTYGWNEGEISLEEYERKRNKFFQKYKH